MVFSCVVPGAARPMSAATAELCRVSPQRPVPPVERGVEDVEELGSLVSTGDVLPLRITMRPVLPVLSDAVNEPTE